MARLIDARTLKAWLSDGHEIALLDVREHGQFGAGHPFFAVPLPYSRFELELVRLVPNPSVRLVLCDAGDEIGERAGGRAESLGYSDVHLLEGGASAWSASGHTLYAGVNVPSKAFGELVEHQRNTPRITAQELQAMRGAGQNLVIVDGRPLSEFRKMNIPGGICCPNGELALRIGAIASDPAATIVVNCAGRTRSIIGAQTLIDMGVPNPVYALENGTQGWFLAGLELDHGAVSRYPQQPPFDLTGERNRAQRLADAHGVTSVGIAEVEAWLNDPSRTTYLFDIRTEEEVQAEPLPGFTHAPGGQLIQTTDHWVGVKGARLILADADSVRAPVIAAWLRQLGHEASVLQTPLAQAARLFAKGRTYTQQLPALKPMSAGELADGIREGNLQIIDLRPSMSYRKAHIAGAVWSIRPRLASVLRSPIGSVVLVASEAGVAALAARDLEEAGCPEARLVDTSDISIWRAAGLSVVATPDDPPDADCIDFLFFTAARHEGDAEAARQYLAWEIALVRQLDEQERSAFRIRAPA